MCPYFVPIRPNIHISNLRQMPLFNIRKNLNDFDKSRMEKSYRKRLEDKTFRTKWDKT